MAELFNTDLNQVFTKEFEIQFDKYRFRGYCGNNKSRPPSVPDDIDEPDKSGDVFRGYLSGIIAKFEIYLPNNYNPAITKVKSSGNTGTGYKEGFLHKSACDVVNATVNNTVFGNVIIAQEISTQ